MEHWTKQTPNLQFEYVSTSYWCECGVLNAQSLTHDVQLVSVPQRCFRCQKKRPSLRGTGLQKCRQCTLLQHPLGSVCQMCSAAGLLEPILCYQGYVLDPKSERYWSAFKPPRGADKHYPSQSFQRWLNKWGSREWETCAQFREFQERLVPSLLRPDYLVNPLESALTLLENDALDEVVLWEGFVQHKWNHQDDQSKLCLLAKNALYELYL